jgi:guanylate kinase
LNNKGLIVLITAPSGAGKTTIYKRVMERNRDLVFSVSYTTRKRRPGEVEGRDYFFVDRKIFEEKKKRNDFVECAVVHGEMYGTDRSQVERCLEKGMVCILDVDVQGAMIVMDKYPEALTIYIQPPSLEDLEKRLRMRGTESEDEIKTRLLSARKELEYSRYFKYIIVNDHLEKAINELEWLINKEKTKG